MTERNMKPSQCNESSTAGKEKEETNSQDVKWKIWTRERKIRKNEAMQGKDMLE
jgi:hypothetical protein